MLPDHISLFTSMYTLNNGITPHAVGQVNGYQKLLDLTAALGHHPLSAGDVKALAACRRAGWSQPRNPQEFKSFLFKYIADLTQPFSPIIIPL